MQKSLPKFKLVPDNDEIEFADADIEQNSDH